MKRLSAGCLFIRLSFLFCPFSCGGASQKKQKQSRKNSCQALSHPGGWCGSNSRFNKQLSSTPFKEFMKSPIFMFLRALEIDCCIVPPFNQACNSGKANMLVPSNSATAKEFVRRSLLNVGPLVWRMGENPLAAFTASRLL
ncbi:hypothetical protein BDZ94DRAFT_393186 [Collybia nuda]|uniref:Secreted protein n=1 Tax=Collybia nuda TaxID=64659 RepID=A0A9P5YAV4_9AGAR|nr:hypothetical protein BDZ94DRAFT_393186 [Collybia nuda]